MIKTAIISETNSHEAIVSCNIPKWSSVEQQFTIFLSRPEFAVADVVDVKNSAISSEPPSWYLSVPEYSTAMKNDRLIETAD